MRFSAPVIGSAAGLSRTLQVAVRAVESESLQSVERHVSREKGCELLGELARALESGRELSLLRGAPRAVVAAAHELERRLFAAVVGAGLAHASGGTLPELPRLLRGFVRLRQELSEASPPEPVPEEGRIQTDIIDFAHDVRSPLTSILFLAETLRQGQSGPTNEQQQHQLAIMYSAALGLVSLANDVIELARAGEGLIERQPSSFSIREVVLSLRDLVQPLADERSLSLQSLTPVDDVRQGYPTTLSRILLNLTTNALQNTDQGMVEIVARAMSGDQVEFSVRDTGRGMDPEIIGRLCKPFHAGTGKYPRTFHGHGLGLAISHKLVHALGSDLAFESSPDWGTRFYFVIELRK